mgnify:FL=1
MLTDCQIQIFVQALELPDGAFNGFWQALMEVRSFWVTFHETGSCNSVFGFSVFRNDGDNLRSLAAVASVTKYIQISIVLIVSGYSSGD